MSSNTYLADALIRHTIYLNRYAGSVANDIKDALEDFIELLDYRIQRKGGIESNSTIPIVELRRDMHRMINGIRVDRIIEDGMAPLAAHEIEYMEGLLLSATTATADTIIKTSPELVYSTVTPVPMHLRDYKGRVSSKTIGELVEQFTDTLPRVVMRRIQFGIAAGDNTAKIARDLEFFVRKRSFRQAEALVRTIANHVGHQARQPAIIANKDLLEGEKFLATLDSRTTFICMKYDQRIFPVDEGPKPALHYGCRSIRVPQVAKRFGLSGLTGERPYRARDEDGNLIIGTVKSDTPIGSFMRRQSNRFQDDALGPERAKLFRSGKITLDKFTDDNGRVIPLSELIKKDKEGLTWQ